MRDRQYEKDELKRLQQIELEMLLEVDRLCKRHNLTYFVDGGTCLGAVRHGGFIPWDDDVDVALPIEDYKKFLDIARKELPKDMTIHVIADTPGYYVQWAKIFKEGTLLLENDAYDTGCQQGIFVDVFPYIPVMDNGDGGEGHLKRTQFWCKACYIYFIKHPNVLTKHRFKVITNAIWRIARFFARVFTTPEWYVRNFQKACESDADGSILGNPTAIRPYPYKREVLLPPRPIQFEGHEVMGPNNCDAYLSQLYGDYMTLPPENQRITHAPFVLKFGDEIE